MDEDLMDEKLRENLNRLAEGILPLVKWLAGTPDQRPNVLAPWREPFTPQLNVRNTGLIDFIERRIADSSEEEAAARKWAEVEEDPVAVFNRLPGKGAAWRAARQLKEEAKFGLVKSGNVEVVLDRPPRASSRRELYGYAFPAFMTVVDAHPPSDWETFSNQLLKDDPALGWPADCPVSAGQFIRQFAKDLLYGLMGMHDQPARPQTTAVLAELGQPRRKGNSYSEENTRAAVAALKLRLADDHIGSTP